MPVAQTVPPGPAEKLDLSFPDGTLDWLLELFARHGDVFRLTTGDDRHIFVVSHPDYVKQVLVTNHASYTKGIGIDRVKILLGNGLMVSEAGFWQRQRKMVQPAFHKNVLNRILAVIREHNVALRAEWQAAADRGNQIDITQSVSDLALGVVLQALFSDDVNLSDEAGSGPFTLLTDDSERNLQFAYRFRSLTKLVQRWIDLRRTERCERFDFLAMLMSSRDKSGAPMSDRELIDEVMTLIVAGHETTASALNWLWYLVSRHPEVEHALHEENDRVTYLDTLDDLDQLSYTRQVIAETLRLYPPGWLLTRRAIVEDRIGDYRVAPNTDIFISPYLVHRHPGFWDEPETFKPERFAAAPRHRFANIPFAAGPRACIGENFALTEMTMHVALISRCLTLRFVQECPLQLEAQVNLRTRHNLSMRPQHRA